MKVVLDIDDYRVEKMFDKYCENTNCQNFPVKVAEGEGYSGCFNKYKNEVFEDHFKGIITKFIEIAYKI